MFQFSPLGLSLNCFHARGQILRCVWLSCFTPCLTSDYTNVNMTVKWSPIYTNWEVCPGDGELFTPTLRTGICFLFVLCRSYIRKACVNNLESWKVWNASEKNNSEWTCPNNGHHRCVRTLFTYHDCLGLLGSTSLWAFWLSDPFFIFCNKPGLDKEKCFLWVCKARKRVVLFPFQQKYMAVVSVLCNRDRNGKETSQEVPQHEGGVMA